MTEVKTVREWLAVRKLKKYEVYSELGVSAPTFEKWCENPGKMSVENYTKLCVLLGVTPDQILLPNALSLS